MRAHRGHPTAATQPRRHRRAAAAPAGTCWRARAGGGGGGGCWRRGCIRGILQQRLNPGGIAERQQHRQAPAGGARAAAGGGGGAGGAGASGASYSSDSTQAASPSGSSTGRHLLQMGSGGGTSSAGSPEGAASQSGRHLLQTAAGVGASGASTAGACAAVQDTATQCISYVPCRALLRLWWLQWLRQCMQMSLHILVVWADIYAYLPALQARLTPTPTWATV